MKKTGREVTKSGNPMIMGCFISMTENAAVNGTSLPLVSFTRTVNTTMVLMRCDVVSSPITTVPSTALIHVGFILSRFCSNQVFDTYEPCKAPLSINTWFKLALRSPKSA